MYKKGNMLSYFLVILIPMAKGAVPGTFFWKPRLGLDLGVPTTEPERQILLPTQYNVELGMVIIFEGYQAGITLVGLAAGLTSGEYYPTLNPLSSSFYTNVYRWTLRYVSLLPFWLSGSGGHYCQTHKVWKRRFYYMDEFVPQWLRHMLFYVKKESWEKEIKDFKRFKKYAEPAFGKHFRYPSKVFNDYLSEYSPETVEEMSISISTKKDD